MKSHNLRVIIQQKIGNLKLVPLTQLSKFRHEISREDIDHALINIEKELKTIGKCGSIL